MNETCGLILIDGDEVIIRIYEKDTQGKWKLLRYQSRDLATFESGKHAEASDIVEVLAEVSLSRYSLHIPEWKICARNLPDEIIKEVSLATNISAELLTLTREQELLSKGMLMELQ